MKLVFKKFGLALLGMPDFRHFLSAAIIFAFLGQGVYGVFMLYHNPFNWAVNVIMITLAVLELLIFLDKVKNQTFSLYTRSCQIIVLILNFALSVLGVNIRGDSIIFSLFFIIIGVVAVTYDMKENINESNSTTK